MSIELQNVSKMIGSETHIRDVSLVFDSSAINVLLGPTLAGKTTLMRLMAGLDQPTSGRVLADGRDVTGVSVRERSVAMVYQQFINYPNLTVYENIASPLRVARLPKRDIDAKVRHAAKLMKLEDLLDRTPLALSGGQQQRIALARALVKGAALVLLDEPFANLDYKLREELREELPRQFGDAGSVLVYATTEPTEALLFGGNTATLHEGRVTQFGPTVEVFRRPNNIITAQTFSDPPLNTIAVEKTGSAFVLGEDLRIPAAKSHARLSDGRYILGFRANHLFLRKPDQDSTALRGRVAVSEITGSESYVHLDAAGERWVALAHGIHEFDVGATIDIYVDPALFFVFDPGGDLAVAPELAKVA